MRAAPSRRFSRKGENRKGEPPRKNLEETNSGFGKTSGAVFRKRNPFLSIFFQNRFWKFFFCKWAKTKKLGFSKTSGGF